MPKFGGLAIERQMPSEIYDFRLRHGLMSRLRSRTPVFNDAPGETIVRLMSSVKAGNVTFVIDGDDVVVPWDATSDQVKAEIMAVTNVVADDVEVRGGPLSNSAQYPMYVRFFGGELGTEFVITASTAMARVDVIQKPTSPGVAAQMGPDELADDRERVWAYEDTFSNRQSRVRRAAARALKITGRGTRRQAFDPDLIRPIPGDQAIDDTPTGP